MNKARAVALGCVSLGVIICGAAMSVLIHLLLSALAKNARDNNVDGSWSVFTRATDTYWLFGLVYIVPGLMCMLAAFVQNRCLYIFTSIVSMISIIVMGIVFVLFGLATVIIIFALGQVSQLCKDADGACSCKSSRSSDRYDKKTPFETCDALDYSLGMAIGIIISMVLAWIFLLTAFVLCCYYACRPIAASEGNILVPSQQPMIQPGEQGFYGKA